MCVSSCRHYFTSSGCKLTSVGSWTQHKLKRSQSCWSLHHFHQQFEILKAGIKRNSDDVSRVPAGWRAELVGSDFNIYTIFMSVSLAAAQRRMWTWQHNKQAVKELLHCSASPLSTSLLHVFHHLADTQTTMKTPGCLSGSRRFCSWSLKLKHMMTSVFTHLKHKKVKYFIRIS